MKTQRKARMGQSELKQHPIELNVLDVNFNQVLTTAFVNLPLSTVTQGAAFYQRDGTVVAPKSLRIGLNVFVPSPVNTCTARVVLARVKYDNSLVSNTDAVNPAGGSGWNTVSDYNRDFVGQTKSDRRLDILKDETFCFSANGCSNISREWDIPLDGLIRFPQSSATAPPITGGLVLFMCDNPSGAVHATLLGYSRLLFADA